MMNCATWLPRCAAELDDPKLYGTFSEYTDPFKNPEWELFFAGHTSPSISLCAGLMKARDMRGEKHNVVAFIGDGSLSGGVAFEGLDAAGALGTNLIVVVNDNQMAIAEDHGSLYRNLRELRETNGTASDNYFKSLGFDYRYVAEGTRLGRPPVLGRGHRGAMWRVGSIRSRERWREKRLRRLFHLPAACLRPAYRRPRAKPTPGIAARFRSGGQTVGKRMSNGVLKKLRSAWRVAASPGCAPVIASMRRGV